MTPSFDKSFPFTEPTRSKAGSALSQDPPNVGISPLLKPLDKAGPALLRVLLLLTFFPAMAVAREVRTIAGTGEKGAAGNGGPAKEATMNNPFGITRGPDGMLYFCELGGNVVRKIDDKGVVTAVAGTGTAGYSGDGGPATAAQLNRPHEVRFGPDGALFIADMSTHTIRRVDGKSGVISTVAGTGKPGFSGDGGPATAAALRDPISIQFGPDGLLYICDIANHRVRTLNMQTGTIATVCGNGKKEPTPDGAPFSPETPLNGPRTIDFDAGGNLWLALREGNAVYRVDAKTKTLHRIAGAGKSGFTGNGGPAKDALVAGPKGLTVSPNGKVYIADTESHTVRVIDPKTGIIDVLVGDGKKGEGPDGPAAQCRLARPHGVFLDKDGTLYIGDSENHRLRAVKAE